MVEFGFYSEDGKLRPIGKLQLNSFPNNFFPKISLLIRDFWQILLSGRSVRTPRGRR